MKLKYMMLGSATVLMISTAACNKASFGNAGGQRREGAIIPGNGVVNPAEEPLDVGKLPENTDERADGGPLPGQGEVLSKTIELTCDNSAGVIVDVTPGTSTDPTTGIDTGTGTDTDIGYEPQKLRKLLGGGDVVIGKDGKPVDGSYDPTGKGSGGKGDDGKGGTGTGGKGGEPLPEIPPVPVKPQTKVIARVKGQMCPQAQNALTMLFVVDFSGSMGRHIPAPGLPEHPGYDPQINGTCGRLEAARAILGKVRAARKPGDKVNVAMVPFAGGIITEKMIQSMDADQFEALVSKDSFCQTIIQNDSFGLDPINPGGMKSPGIDASTNYNAALTAATSLLSGAYGRKVVYFLSDGEPTSGGIDPVQAGIKAGAALRASVDNLTLNALLLGEPGNSAEDVLVATAGAPERVRRVSNAADLAESILAFPDASIDVTTGRAVLTIPPYEPEADVGLRYFAADTAHPGIYVYETQPFYLLGKPGETVEHTVEVTARSLDGSTHKSTVKIRYRQE